MITNEMLKSTAWHHLTVNAVVKELNTNIERGLTSEQAAERLDQFGLNRITPKKGKSPFMRFLEQFNSPLIYILIGASVVTAVLKDYSDAAIIFGVVLVNAIIGYLQESKAEKAIEALKHAMTAEAVVVRDGKQLQIAAERLVVGDIVLLQAGDKVPADLRLIESRDLQIAEAALTGESVPVSKNAAVMLSKEAVLAEQINMAFASTLVTYGTAKGIVVKSGDSTEVGLISQLISETETLETPLTRKITQFSNSFLMVILVFALISFLINIFRSGSLSAEYLGETLKAAIALSVAAIPEGLPAAVTITLAIGVTRMAQRRAIIRKLPAVETLGSVTVICSDKTGTLTQNQMTVQRIVAGNQAYEVDGIGYTAEGKIRLADEDVEEDNEEKIQEHVALRETLLAGLLCNDSSLFFKDGEWQVSGDPTEAALIVSANKGGFDEKIKENYPRLDSLPFDSTHQYMATYHACKDSGQGVIYVKGAVEKILERCAYALDQQGKEVFLNKDEIQQEVARSAANGLRVLAFARKSTTADKRGLSHEDVSQELVFLGLQAMIDPPRPEVIDAVRRCQQAGIRVKMITGDHVLTAVAIAKKIGIIGKKVIARIGSMETCLALTGQEMAAMDEESFNEAAECTAVFARVSPQQKLQLVKAMQQHSHIVAMTGDGVNDGPALKQADIGVAMGMAGTEVAKESADMVLTDDNFATIAVAIEEGRAVFDNLVKIITWTLPTNVGEGLIIMVALILGTQLPILPVQILWINMVTVILLGVTLAFETKEPDIMNRPPRDVKAGIVSKEMLLRIIIVGVYILIGAYGLFQWELSAGHTIESARTAAVNVVVMAEVFYLLNCRSLTHSMFKIGLFSNPILLWGVLTMVALQVLFNYVPAFHWIFESASTTPESWGKVLLIGFGVYLLVEYKKWLMRHAKTWWDARQDS